jgi:hypothetical protein
MTGNRLGGGGPKAARDVLSACIALAFAATALTFGAAAPAWAGGTTWTVENCDDDSPGSLRQILSLAADGDTVDMTSLACSTITLTSGQLVVDLDNIALLGTDIVIDAAGPHRVLYHTGTGTLSASGITFAYGLGGGAPGGCISSRGSVALDHVTVRDCVTSGPTHINGGGVFAAGDIELRYTTITGNSTVVTNPGHYDGASGAGLCAGGNLTMFHSTISGNSLLSTSAYSGGGGFVAGPESTIDHSTISGNHANRAGAGIIGSGPPASTGSSIIDSTISGNTSDENNAGIESFDDLRIRNSSIVFNDAADGFCGAGVLEFGTLQLDSSIVAGNTTGGLADDICMQGPEPFVVLGANDIVIAALGDLPADTIRTDPMLAPLADNGGGTMTHALLPGSPAIDHGSNPLQLDTDQRGLARVVGDAPDIGAYELQPSDEIFADGFDSAVAKSTM